MRRGTIDLYPMPSARDFNALKKSRDTTALTFHTADNQTIVASKYQLYLPTEQALMAEVKKEIDKVDQL